MKTSAGKSILLLCLMLYYSCSTIWAAAGDLVWKFKAGGALETCPAVAEDGTIYFGSNGKRQVKSEMLTESLLQK